MLSCFIPDTYFLINWLDEEEDNLFDVVSVESVVSPEGTDILSLIPYTVYRVGYAGQFYWSQVIEHGKNMYCIYLLYIKQRYDNFWVIAM